MSEPFMNLLIGGNAFLDDVDDHIGAWQADTHEQSLAQFLGMTDEEYGLWVEEPVALRYIAKARIEGGDLPLYEAVAKVLTQPIAMRASDAGEAQVVLTWLRETGRIKT